jgi:hypothetical protein
MAMSTLLNIRRWTLLSRSTIRPQKGRLKRAVRENRPTIIPATEIPVPISTRYFPNIVATMKKENELIVLIRITRIYDLFQSLAEVGCVSGLFINCPSEERGHLRALALVYKDLKKRLVLF